jgi:hypothetical protein
MSFQGRPKLFDRFGAVSSNDEKARAKNYLKFSRGLGGERIESLDHCFRARLEVELWITPKKSAIPPTCPLKATKR